LALAARAGNVGWGKAFSVKTTLEIAKQWPDYGGAVGVQAGRNASSIAGAKTAGGALMHSNAWGCVPL